MIYGEVEYLVKDCNITFLFFFICGVMGVKLGYLRSSGSFYRAQKRQNMTGVVYTAYYHYTLWMARLAFWRVWSTFFLSFFVSPCQSTHLRYHTNCILIFSALNMISPCLRNDMIMSFHLAFLPELDHPDWYQPREL